MRTHALLSLFIVTLLITAKSFAVTPDLSFVTIPAGSFTMGTIDLEEAQFEIPPDSTLSINDEQPAHKVRLTSFEIGKYEITQAQWLDVMGTRPGPDSHWRHAQWQQLPVVSVSWNMAQKFISELNTQSDHYHYRLPTEAEFEYILRAGSSDLRPFEGEQMDDYAWTITNSGDAPQPVGQLKANAFGVHDSFGNAWEWVDDWYHPKAYTRHTLTNPKTEDDSSGKKVRRGGSYHCPTHLIRSAYRAADNPDTRYSVIGFRLVREKRK